MTRKVSPCLCGEIGRKLTESWKMAQACEGEAGQRAEGSCKGRGLTLKAIELPSVAKK